MRNKLPTFPRARLRRAQRALHRRGEGVTLTAELRLDSRATGFHDGGLKLVRLVALTFSCAAPASPPVQPIRLRYEVTLAEAVCPSEREFKALVSAETGNDPFSDQAQLTARVKITRRAGHLAGTMELVDETNAVVDSVTLDGGSDCGSLAGTLALKLAYRIDPPPPPPPPPVEEPRGDDMEEVGPVEGTTTPPPLLPPPPPPPPPVQVNVLAGGSASLGLLPALAPGGTVALDVRRGNLSLELDGTVFPNVSFQSLGGRVDTSLISTSVAGCGWIGLGEVCARATGGLFRADGTGYPGSQGGFLITASLGCAAGVQWRLGSALLLKARLGASLPLLRSSILVGTTRVWEVSDVPIDGSLFVGWAVQ